MSRFILGLRLIFRYLVYCLITVCVYLMVAQFFGGDNGQYLYGYGYTSNTMLALIAGGCVALYLLFVGRQETLEFYTYNKVGSGRAARVLYRHRDVVQVDASWQFQWRAAVKYSFFYHVIPANVWGLGALLAVMHFFSEGTWLPSLLIGLVSYFFGMFSSWYAAHHLCNPEVNEMYERPQTYSDVISQEKQERSQRRAAHQAQEQLERERRRNRPMPPRSQRQKRPPRRPY